MDGRAQGFRPSRMFGTTVKVPDLRFVQWTKCTLSSIEVNEVLVLPIDHPYRPVPDGLKYAIFLKMLREGQSLAFSLAIPVQPPRQ